MTPEEQIRKLKAGINVRAAMLDRQKKELEAAKELAMAARRAVDYFNNTRLSMDRVQGAMSTLQEKLAAFDEATRR